MGQLVILTYSFVPGELKKLLSSFVSGSGGKNGGYIRKITPTAAESLVPKLSITQQKLQVKGFPAIARVGGKVMQVFPEVVAPRRIQDHFCGHRAWERALGKELRSSSLAVVEGHGMADCCSWGSSQPPGPEAKGEAEARAHLGCPCFVQGATSVGICFALGCLGIGPDPGP